jgi:hypothetical protein
MIKIMLYKGTPAYNLYSVLNVVGNSTAVLHLWFMVHVVCGMYQSLHVKLSYCLKQMFSKIIHQTI